MKTKILLLTFILFSMANTQISLFGNQPSVLFSSPTQSSYNQEIEKNKDSKEEHKRQLEFADFLFNMGEYENATTEYLKISIFNSSDSLIERLATASYNAKNYSLAEKYLSQLFIKTKNEDFAQKLFNIYEQNKEYDKALFIATNLQKNREWYSSKYLFLLGKTDSAKIVLQSQTSPRYSINKEIILEFMNKEFKPKNYALGSMASLFPGGGYFYTQRYGDGFFTSIIVIPLAIVSAIYFINDDTIKGAVWGSIGGVFYLGSIYGGIKSVGKYNKQVEIYRNSKILENYNIDETKWILD